LAAKAGDKQSSKQAGDGKAGTEEHDENKLDDMLQELRILLQGLQVLTAFLIILPFNEGFAKIDDVEKWVYMVTFLCALAGLIILSAPAAQHRLERPLMDRVRFKDLATRMIIIGLIPASVALVLATQLVVAQAVGLTQSYVAAGLVAALIAALWWIMPLAHKDKA
jgi:Ca2+/Na+ antiporter